MGEYTPIIRNGNDVTRTASAAITGKQVCIVSGDGTVAPASGASALVVGVALFDMISGGRVTLSRDPEQLLTASGAITAGDALESAAGGKVATHTLGTNDNRIIGYALTTAADAADVRVAWTK